ncbi:MAG TPA: hypothetical protein VH375_08720, partial [Rhodanobacteraceae bacterium]
MPDLPIVALVITAAALGVLAGSLFLLPFVRRWTAQAREAGRAARDGEIAVLAAQREAAGSRADELQRRVDRFEREWTAAEQNLRQLTANAARHQADAERLKHDLGEASRSRDGIQQRLEDLSARYAALEA